MIQVRNSDGVPINRKVYNDNIALSDRRIGVAEDSSGAIFVGMKSIVCCNRALIDKIDPVGLASFHSVDVVIWSIY